MRTFDSRTKPTAKLDEAKRYNMGLPFGLPSLGSPKLLASWFGAGALSVVLPILIFCLARLRNSASNEDYNNNENNEDENEVKTPWWYFGGNPDRREEDKAPAVLIATYLWSLMVFFGILIYGRFVLRAGADLHGLVVALCLFANFSIISLFMVSGVEYVFSFLECGVLRPSMYNLWNCDSLIAVHAYLLSRIVEK